MYVCAWKMSVKYDDARDEIEVFDTNIFGQPNGDICNALHRPRRQEEERLNKGIDRPPREKWRVASYSKMKSLQCTNDMCETSESLRVSIGQGSSSVPALQ